MSNTTLDMLSGLLTPDLLRTAGKAIGESDTGVAKALGAAFPAILGQMVQGANNSTLMGNIVEMAKNPAIGSLLGSGGGILSTVGSILTLGAAGSGPFSSITTGLLSALFGNKIGDLGRAIGSLAGLKHPGSAGSLLGLAAPMVLAALGNKLGGSMTGTGLSVLLGQEKNSIMKALPGPLGSALGLVGGAGMAAAAAPIVNAAPAAAPARVAAAAPAPHVATPAARAATPAPAPVYDDEPRGGSVLGSILGLIITGAVIAGLVFGISQCRRATETAVAPPAAAPKVAEAPKPAPAPAPAAKPVEAPKPVASAPAPAPVAPPPAAAPAPAPAAPAKPVSVLGGLKPGEGGLMSLALPTGKTISMAAKGVEAQLIEFLEDASRPIDKGTWFDFDRLNFKTASSELTPESRSQVEAVAEIMKAFPTSEVKIGGYTDNVGNPENNLKLSDTRAKSVATELVALGIAATRLDAEGYGEQHAIADNATPEGRAKNRRTALSVRKR